VKCVSLDLDGTLLNSKMEITEASKETIFELKNKGYEVIINTGRAYHDVIKVPGIKELNCPIICVNGSMIFSKNGKMQFEAMLDRPVYKEVFNRVADLNVGMLVYTDQGGFPSTLPPLHHKSKEEIDLMFRHFDYEELFQRENLKVYKLIALAHHDELDEVEKVKQALADMNELSMASSFPNNVEITSYDAHKGRSLLRYAKINQLHFEEIYAFGDGGNDLSQFEIATTSVAMANAPETIKECADLVTKSNDEDGIAHAVKHLLKLI
jgi:Cof subfamily protein (haloacid dehalogenase superfamily)